MLGSGVAVFGDKEDYAQTLKGFGYSRFLLVEDRCFRARMVRLALHRIILLRLDERLGRVASCFCAPGWRRFVLSPATGRVIVGGVEVSRASMVTFGAGPVIQERTEGPGESRILLVPEDFLAAHSRGLMGRALGLAPGVRRWRSSTGEIDCLNALHGAATRVTATRLLQTHSTEAYRGLEQELVRILVQCLTTGRADNDSDDMDRRAEIVARFEVDPGRSTVLAPFVGKDLWNSQYADVTAQEIVS